MTFYYKKSTLFQMCHMSFKGSYPSDEEIVTCVECPVAVSVLSDEKERKVRERQKKLIHHTPYPDVDT